MTSLLSPEPVQSIAVLTEHLHEAAVSPWVSQNGSKALRGGEERQIVQRCQMRGNKEESTGA